MFRLQLDLFGIPIVQAKRCLRSKHLKGKSSQALLELHLVTFDTKLPQSERRSLSLKTFSSAGLLGQQRAWYLSKLTSRAYFRLQPRLYFAPSFDFHPDPASYVCIRRHSRSTK